jgi:hypothetical protein
MVTAIKTLRRDDECVKISKFRKTDRGISPTKKTPTRQRYITGCRGLAVFSCMTIKKPHPKMRLVKLSF